MAGCYHDQQEFKSDLTIEVAREDDILKGGQGLDEIECDKNPGHRDFIPFKDLTLEHLPSANRNAETLEYLKQKGSRVVRLEVERKLGSGYVMRYNNQYFIRTNNHVVRTEDEVKHCIVEFHYDDDSRSSVITSRGVKLYYTDPYRDIALFTFHPIPDFLYKQHYEDDKVLYVNIMLKNNKTISIIPLPKSSDSSFSRLNLNRSDIYLMFISYPDGFIGYIKSSFFKFKPIPSNVQELTSVEVYIDEEDGNRRVIPGDVVQCGDDIVVKISEYIFQDEVKKCRVVWNDKFIGRGTRLYFNQCNFKDISNACGIDKYIYNVDWWEFNFRPKKESKIKDVNDPLGNVCCIGHPHGASKHITFGRILGYSMNKFDNQHRHITQLGSDCQCQEVCCVEYSCKTCRGSSGSPVFKLRYFDSMSYYIHFIGESENREKDGNHIGNINRAWVVGVNV